MSDCLFCRIANGEIPSRKVFEDDRVYAFEDIAPKADVHLLVLPERHIETFREIGAFPPDEAKRMLDFVAETARAAGLEEYRLMIFVGAGAGQTVFHLHWHILGGGLRGLPG